MQRRTFLAAAAAAATGAAATLNPSFAMAAETNPMLAQWTGPYGGVPAFDKVKVADFKPALEAAMAENLAQVDAIVANSAPATFENTIAAMEDSGRTLDAVGTYYGIWGGNLTTPDFQAVQTEMNPKIGRAHV